MAAAAEALSWKWAKIDCWLLTLTWSGLARAEVIAVIRDLKSFPTFSVAPAPSARSVQVAACGFDPAAMGLRDSGRLRPISDLSGDGVALGIRLAIARLDKITFSCPRF